MFWLNPRCDHGIAFCDWKSGVVVLVLNSGTLLFADIEALGRDEDLVGPEEADVAELDLANDGVLSDVSEADLEETALGLVICAPCGTNETKEGLVVGVDPSWGMALLWP